MIHSKGHISAHDIVTALKASGVDADEAFIELSRPPDQKASGAFSVIQLMKTCIRTRVEYTYVYSNVEKNS